MLKGLVLIIGTLGATAVPAATWQVESVEQSGAGKFSSLKVDQSGNVHLVYVIDEQQALLKYGFWDHALKRWFGMAVAPGASFPWLVLDSNQHPRVSWADAGSILGTKLHYAYWDGIAWKKEAIPLTAQNVAFLTSIALDNHDNPSLSYYEVEGPKGSGFRVRMRVVTWNGKYWEVRTVDGSNQSGKFNSLAADAQGRIHLAYANMNAGTAGVRYSVFDGNSWSAPELVEDYRVSREYFGWGLNETVDSSGDPHLVYFNYSHSAVKYAKRKNGRWQTEVVEELGGVGYPDRNSIALDGQGRPFISYFDAKRGELHLAHREGEKWVVETVDRNGAGYTSSVQVSQDTVWISYMDEPNSALKVAHAPLSEFAPATTSQVRGAERAVASPGLRP